MSENLMGQFQGSRCFFKRNLLNYLIPSYTVSEKENGLQHLWLRPHEFIESGCQGELRGGASHPPPPPPHTQELTAGIVKCFSFCSKQLNTGSEVLTFMLSSCLYFSFLNENNYFFKESKREKNITEQLLTCAGLKFSQEESVQSCEYGNSEMSCKFPRHEEIRSC